MIVGLNDVLTAEMGRGVDKQREFRIQTKGCCSILENRIEVVVNGWKLTQVEVSEFSLAWWPSGWMSLRGSGW